MFTRSLRLAVLNAKTAIRKCFLVLVLLIFSGSFLVFGQNAPSLNNAVIDSINEATNPFSRENRHFGIAHYRNLLKNSIANDHQKGIIGSYYNLGQYYRYIDNQSDSAVAYFDKAILLMQKTGIENENLYRTYNNKAITIAEAGMEFLSLESFQKAYEASLKNGNAVEILRAKVNLTELNKALGNYQKAINLATELLEDTPSMDNTSKAILNGIIGGSLVKSNKPRQALSFLEICDSLYTSDMHEGTLIENRTWMAHAYLAMGNFKKAIHISESLVKDFPDYPGNLQLTSLVLGKALFQDKQTNKGIKVLEEGLKLKGTSEEQITILETLGFFYLSRKDFEQAQPLLNKAIAMRDSIQVLRSQRFSRYSSISYDLLETQYKNDALSHKNEVLEAKAIQREYIVGLLILSVAILLLSILGYILWKKYHSGKKTIKSLKANEKAILEAHIKLREDELGATMAHLNKSMKTLKSITSDLGTSIRNKDYASLENIKRALKEHQESSSATSLLTDRVESQYPRMTTQLREMYPNFTPNDVKHCVMIKLGLSLKETAQLFNITVAAVKSARGRMRKKMGLDADVSLRQHLSHMAKSA